MAEQQTHELVAEMMGNDPLTKRVVCTCGQPKTIYFRGSTDGEGREWTVDEVIEAAIAQIMTAEPQRLCAPDA